MCSLLLEHPTFGAEEKTSLLKARLCWSGFSSRTCAHTAALQGCQGLYLALDSSVGQQLSTFRQLASSGPLRLSPPQTADAAVRVAPHGACCFALNTICRHRRCAGTKSGRECGGAGKRG